LVSTFKIDYYMIQAEACNLRKIYKIKILRFTYAVAR
jgi:hypothetical protein